MWTIVGLAVFVFILYHLSRIFLWYRAILNVGSRLNKLPGEKGHWLFGNMHKHPGPNEAGLQFLMDYVQRHGYRAARFWFGPVRPNLMVVHPDVIKIILKTTEPKALKNAGAYSMVAPWLGDGLLISKGQKWFRNRKLLTPAFHFDILRPYMQTYNEAADVMMDKWCEQLKQSPKASVEIYSSVCLCTLDIILKCAFSYNADVQHSGTDNTYIQSVLSLSEMVVERIFNVWWYVDWIYGCTSHGKLFYKRCAYVHDVAQSIIETRKEVLSKNPDLSKGRRLDFLDILLMAKDESGNGLTDLEIRHEVDTFLFEGHDTTASAISWCLYNLAKNPEHQERARQEIDQLLEGRDSPIITWDDMAQLTYLTMCIRESLRLIPPVPFIARDLTVPMEFEGVSLLPGTIIDIPLYLLHHNPHVWGDDHMEYKPERFHAENMKKMDPYAFMPFSAGPRNCIGQVFALHELKVVIARVLHRFVLSVDPEHKPEMRPVLVMRAKDGIKLLLTERR